MNFFSNEGYSLSKEFALSESKFLPLRVALMQWKTGIGIHEWSPLMVY